MTPTWLSRTLTAIPTAPRGESHGRTINRRRTCRWAARFGSGRRLDIHAISPARRRASGLAPTLHVGGPRSRTVGSVRCGGEGNAPMLARGKGWAVSLRDKRRSHAAGRGFPFPGTVEVARGHPNPDGRRHPGHDGVPHRPAGADEQLRERRRVDSRTHACDGPARGGGYARRPRWTGLGPGGRGVG